jgi:diguanylate cyclase (GGDEF)-like protein
MRVTRGWLDRLERPWGPDDDAQQTFWRAHLRIGFGVFLGDALAVLLYLFLTPHGPHRAVLIAMAGGWIAFALVNLLLAPRVAAKHWRARFSTTWTILSAFAVAGFAALDGGLDSPVVLLLFLPVGFAALAFTPAAAVACGLSTLASVSIITFCVSHVHLSRESVFMLLATLAGASVLSVAAATNRGRRERHEELLMDKIAGLAATDGLTGCVVHRVFRERLAEEINRSWRFGDSLSLMMIDLDDFKGVNDTYGHLVGDTVLATIGAGIRAHTRSIDVVGRVGGDEFAVLMPNTEPETALTLARRVLHEIPAALEIPMTLSIGVSALDRFHPTSEQMIDDADFALYEVKRSGRNGVAVRIPDPVLQRERPDSVSPLQ